MGRQSRKHAKRRAEAEAAAAAAPPATSTSHSPPARKRKLSSGLNNSEAERLFRLITSKLKDYPCVPQPLPRRLKIGTRSLKDKDPSLLTWTCKKCKRINYPRRYVLTDLPVIDCECGEEGDIEFDFSMANLEVNGECPIVNVKNQRKERNCTVFSTASNIEATLRMRQILSGEKLEHNKPVVNIGQLLDQYEFMRVQYGINQKPEEKWNYKTIQSLFIGVGIFGAVTEEPRVHELGDHVTVNRNFYDICRVLADGQPLTTGIVPGKNFRHLKPGQIYKAPKKEKFTANKKDTGHAILLIGAGRRRKTNYYHFLNSWGENFCLTDDGRGGFGMVRASDITLRPLKFIRYKEEVVHHQSLASTYKKPGAANEMPSASQEVQYECTQLSGSSSAEDGHDQKLQQLKSKEESTHIKYSSPSMLLKMIEPPTALQEKVRCFLDDCLDHRGLVKILASLLAMCRSTLLLKALLGLQTLAGRVHALQQHNLEGGVVYDFELKIGWEGRFLVLPCELSLLTISFLYAVLGGTIISGPGGTPVADVTPQTSELVFIPSVPDMVVPPPDDSHLRHVIDTMALLVLDGGFSFEESVMEIGRWIPPALPSSRSPDHEKKSMSAAGRSMHVEVERILTHSQRDESEDMLCAPTLEGSQIKEATGLVLDNADATGEIVEVFAEFLTLKEACNATKVAKHIFQTKFDAVIPDAMQSFINLYRSVTGTVTAEELKWVLRLLPCSEYPEEKGLLGTYEMERKVRATIAVFSLNVVYLLQMMQTVGILLKEHWNGKKNGTRMPMILPGNGIAFFKEAVTV